MPSIDRASVLVVGGTGSFGRHLVSHLLINANPKRLVVFSRDEAKQHDMEQDFSPKEHDCLRYFIGDVRDRERLETAMRGIDIVVHAAAMKQIVAAEYNPFECIKTNVIGAENVVTAAIRAGVKRVIALSTDKAANPINLYGASKLASDKIFIAANNIGVPVGCRFSVVRYGNVIGSRGSVVPLFQRLVRDGATEIPITDNRMTRFWITLDHGVSFVLSSLDMMQGGEIFVPKIPSMRVTDVADVIAPGIPQKVIGIRPGEKLHETMITEDDARTTVSVGDRYVIEPSWAGWDRHSLLEQGGDAVPEGFRYSSDANSDWLDADGLKALLAEMDSK
ncbi:MAG: UDP-N-acetylglucosamine 4,6-dehydratase (inverting) [Alphaproteobacteria bacterium]